MKKLMKVAGVVSVLGVSSLFFGCTPQQQQAVSKQLGIAAAVTWIGIDNPNSEDIAAVRGVVSVIQELSCTNCTIDSSYYARVYPLVDDYITNNLKPNQQPVARLGSAFILTSLDTAFAMNPNWKENVDTASAMVTSFCQGVDIGLAMAPTDPVMIAAKRGISVRAVSGKIK